MKSNFILLNKVSELSQYIDKVLINYPKHERVLKHNINECMSKIIEYILMFNKSDSFRLKDKYLKVVLIKISMLNFYIELPLEKTTNKINYQNIITLLTEIKRITFKLIKISCL